MDRLRASLNNSPNPLTPDLQTFSAHEIRGPRSQFRSFGPATKWWIKWMRIVQLAFRVLEMIVAAGILFLMIVITEVSPLTAWVMRITVSGIHLIRPCLCLIPNQLHYTP